LEYYYLLKEQTHTYAIYFFAAYYIVKLIIHRQMNDIKDDYFRVKYLIRARTLVESYSIADELRYEQTVELPETLVKRESWIGKNVVGQIDLIERELKSLLSSHHDHDDDADSENDMLNFIAYVSYHTNTTGNELPQLINVIFGNTSIKENVMVIDIEFGKNVENAYAGPRFGVKGLRKLLNVKYGPLLMTALKPMGTSADKLAEMAFAFALGGIDIIKDDHGLANQVWAPFEERVTKCAKAVKRANAITGRNCLYAPCLNAPAHLVLKRAKFAKAAGCGAVLMLPGLTGLDTCRVLAEDAEFNLPIIAHPSISGAMLGGGSRNEVRGFSHKVLLGILPRLAGCDVTIFPNFGGRFGFSKDECQDIQRGCTSVLGSKPAIFPSPGGGMTLEKIKIMREAYGQDVLLLIGGSLYSHSNDLTANARHFMQMAGRTDLYGPDECQLGGASKAANNNLGSGDYYYELNKDNDFKHHHQHKDKDSSSTAAISRFESIFQASPAHLKKHQSPLNHHHHHQNDPPTTPYLPKLTPNSNSISDPEVRELREKNIALEKKLDELTALVAKLASGSEHITASKHHHKHATDGLLEGNHSKVLVKKDKKFMWNRVEREMYKMDGGSFKGCSRVELIGKRGESTNFHVRYFEVSPGGWTTLEKHNHEHVVIILNGSGYVQLGSESYAMHVGDVGYTSPGDVHQLRCAEEALENFGFICIVSADRDRPVEIDAGEHLMFCERVSGNHLEETIRKSLQQQVKHRNAQRKNLKNPDGSYAEGSACEWTPGMKNMKK
jgi:ribulose-bisphosphate carboxylase large chain